MPFDSVKTLTEYHLQQEQLFQASRRKSVNSESGTRMLLNNPSGSGRDAEIAIIEVDSGAKTFIDVYKNPTIDTSGTTLTTYNRYIDSSVSPQLNVAFSGIYSGRASEPFSKIVGPGGVGGNRIGGSMRTAPIKLTENNSMLIEVTNKANNAEDISIRLAWAEVNP